ncbi:MAG: ATP synthase F1 subunit gamma [Opitutales bacterium]|nr:ATP synthase F1 subunit gamma [Opitutales bacterium]
MSKIAHIKHRIRSVKNTRQITKAMELVASSKMKRAQDRAIAGRDYALLLARLLHIATTHAEIPNHPLMEKREVKRRGILVLSTDKGLCGPLNANLFREINKIKGEADFVSVGRKAKQYLSRTGRNLVADFSVSDRVAFGEVRPIIEHMLEQYRSGRIDTLEVVFPRFINTLIQKTLTVRVLPILDLQEMIDTLDLKKDHKHVEDLEDNREIKFEPSAPEILEKLPDLFIKEQLYQFIVSAKASEHSARRVAMKNASDNASKLVDSLILKYNKARQAAITQEIVEISAAAASD